MIIFCQIKNSVYFFKYFPVKEENAMFLNTFLPPSQAQSYAFYVGTSSPKVKSYFFKVESSWQTIKETDGLQN